MKIEQHTFLAHGMMPIQYIETAIFSNIEESWPLIKTLRSHLEISKNSENVLMPCIIPFRNLSPRKVLMPMFRNFETVLQSILLPQ